MTSVERPETNAVVVDEPAAAVTAVPAVAVDVVPTPKAAGPQWTTRWGRAQFEGRDSVWGPLAGP